MKDCEEYYVGLDCGTESVGFAVTDKDYNVLKFHGKSMWGSHLFDEAKTAKERRGFRAARRRNERKKERIKLVQGLFAEEIAKVDPLFFQRLNDSHYFPEDKTYNQPNSIFNDADFSDKEYFRLYPTIFHLRDALRRGVAKKDPRLLYLAIHHIIKNRGHFLFTVSDDLKSVMDPSSLLDDIRDTAEAVFDGSTLSFSDYDALKSSLVGKRFSSRKELLKNVVSFEDSKKTAMFISLLIGAKVKPAKLFDNEGYEDLPDIDFRSSSFSESSLPQLEEGLNDDEYRLIILFKGVYDWALLAGVMAGSSFISEAKIKQFELNNEDLRKLKKAIKLHSPSSYDDFFHKDDVGSFSSYIGCIHDKKLKKSVRRTSVDEFYKKIRKLIGNNPEDPESIYVLEKIDEDSFLHLLISSKNSIIPYQVNKAEMDEILRVASSDFPFLLEKDETGLTVINKLDMIIKFRIPYYVGPVGRNDKEISGWAVRKRDGKILPWNFDDIIDSDASAEGFIRAMTNKCTYLPGEDVLPKNSILYSRFMVLNELNNVRVNGQLLTVSQKQSIYQELFCKKKKVTQKQLHNFMIAEGWYSKSDDIQISGIDGDFKSSLSSYLDFLPYVESRKLRWSDAEEIIKWITLFSDGGAIASRKIKAAFGSSLSADDIRIISHRNYTGWGRLSEKFLTGIYSADKNTGEALSIIKMMWETQNNLMQLLSSDFEFIEQTGNKEPVDKLDYGIVEELAVSPSVKRQIWQTLKIVDEIEHIMGFPPEKIFLEVPRGGGEKGKRTVSRKDDLISKLKNHSRELSSDEKEILAALEAEDSSLLSRRDKLYLYFTQLGKCMYTGKPINLSELDTDLYDVDHIYPISRSNDDSLTNKVLVLKSENSRKSDTFPIGDDIRNKMERFWKHLLTMGLIPQEKYKRLTRGSALTAEDDNGFIARQLVETSQSAKATADILQRYFGGKTQIIYSKARNVSAFRDKFNMIKLRSLNNLHHAKDAYLNIVVGNILHTKYTKAFIMHRENKNPYYNISKPYDTDIPGAWQAGNDGSISVVRKQVARNDVLYTKQCIEVGGGLFDQMPVAAGTKKGALPLKMSDPVLRKRLSDSDDSEKVLSDWTDKYGGYNNQTTAYFSLIKHKAKGKDFVSFVPISIVDSINLKNDSELAEFCKTRLHMDDVHVLRRRILKNTKIAIDGFKFIITGKASGGSIILAESAFPLLLDDEIAARIKRIEKFVERKRQDKNLLVDSIHDGITAEGNIEIYDTLVEKANNNLYIKRPSCQASLLVKGRDRFISLSLENQAQLIMNLMSYFAMGGGRTDLSFIGGSSSAGIINFGAKISIREKHLVIYDSSITGLFERAEEFGV